MLSGLGSDLTGLARAKKEFFAARQRDFEGALCLIGDVHLGSNSLLS